MLVRSANAFRTVVFAFRLRDTRPRVGTQHLSVREKSPGSQASVLNDEPPVRFYTSDPTQTSFRGTQTKTARDGGQRRVYTEAAMRFSEHEVGVPA